MNQVINQQDLVSRLLTARKTGTPIVVAPEDVPHSETVAYAVQHAVMQGLGPIGGWKVGASGPEAVPATAPLPASGILPSPALLGTRYNDRLVEAEIAFRLAEDLPPGGAPYTREEVLAAIGSCHPVIEVVQWRIRDYGAASPNLKLADSIGHGALIVGAAVPNWTTIDFAKLQVTQAIEDQQPNRGIGNPAGDMIRLITWLANQGAVWAGGLKAGQVVTCGSWTGVTAVTAGAAVTAAFAGLDPVQLRFQRAAP